MRRGAMKKLMHMRAMSRVLMNILQLSPRLEIGKIKSSYSNAAIIKPGYTMCLVD